MYKPHDYQGLAATARLYCKRLNATYVVVERTFPYGVEIDVMRLTDYETSVREGEEQIVYLVAPDMRQGAWADRKDPPWR